jgi:hypothetical protein
MNIPEVSPSDHRSHPVGLTPPVPFSKEGFKMRFGPRPATAAVAAASDPQTSAAAMHKRCIEGRLNPVL